MLYIFLVNTGTMLTFDVSWAVKSVETLKKEIAKVTGIPEDKQVLLVSGGENLEDSARLGNYSSAGADTSPVFLFDKTAIESAVPPLPNVELASDIDLSVQVETCKDLQPTYHSVVTRVQLAQQFHENANTICRECRKLVNDQHTQHQGWAAVIANLEDLTRAFEGRAKSFQSSYMQYLESRNSYMELCQDFSNDLQMLSRIPVLPALLGESAEKPPEGSSDFITLLEWISSKDNQSSLEHIADQCARGLDTHVPETLEVFRTEIREALTQADNPELKEIGGVSDRLYGLDQLMYEAQRIVSEQGALAQALLQNQTRAANLRDPSILPDLCASHQHQLQLLLHNHQKLRDIHHRCAVAKQELSANLHARLRWVMYVEKNIYEIDSRLAIFHENLKRLKRHLEVIQQIHRAPKIYLSAVVEVVRRNSFTKTYLQWSSSLAQQSSELHKKEISTRQEFNSQIANHFLQSLFPGMEDFPPSFATEAPEAFDVNLPKLLASDIETLKQVLPDLSNLLKVPSIDPMPRVSLAMTDSAFESDIPSSSRAAPCCTSPVSSTTSGQNTQHSEQGDAAAAKAGSHHGLSSRTVSSASDPSPTQDYVMSSLDSAAAAKGINEGRGSVEQQEASGTDSAVQPPPPVSRHHTEGTKHEKRCAPPIVEEQEERESDTEEFEQVYDADVKPDTATEEDPMKVSISAHDQECSWNERSHFYQVHSRASSGGHLSDKSAAAAAAEGELGLPGGVHSDDDFQAPSSDHHQSSDSCLTTSQDFLTADFFIDESMPSSYTESNGTSGTGRGSHCLKTHHIIVAELQRQLEEKANALISVQGECKSHRTRLNLVTDSLVAMHEMVQKSQQQLRGEMNMLKEHVLHEREFVLEELLALAMKLKTAVEKVRVQASIDKNQAVEEAISKVQSENQAILQMCQKQLEVEVHKLNDAHKEIDIYQDQLRQQTVALEALKQEMESRVSEVKIELEAENRDLEKRLTLEHELELVNLRDELEKKHESKQLEINDLKEALMEKETQFQLLQKEKQMIEENLREQFQKEKDELMKIMENSFRQREQEAVEWALQEQEQCHRAEIERLKEEFEKIKGEAVMSACREEEQKWQSKIQEIQKELEEKHQSAIEQLHVEHMQNKQLELRQLEERLEQSHKSEVESLRSRFKLAMSASMIVERSPSDNSLEKTNHEQQFQEEKMRCVAEAIEQERSRQQAEFQKCLQEENRKHEEMMNQLQMKMKAEHEEETKAIKAVFAEREKKLNETVSRKIREKNHAIKELQEKDASLREELWKERAYIEKLLQGTLDPNSPMSQALDEALRRERDTRERCQKVEKELAELRQKREPRRLSDQLGMQDLSTSIVPLKDSTMKGSTIIQDPRVADLESRLLSKDIEIMTLKNKLVEASEPKHPVDKITLFGCEVNDVVLVFYDEKHANYVAYQACSHLYFVNSECLDALGLKLNAEVKKFAIAVITEKEYCEARKVTNRFNVPVGTRFYRIKVKPWVMPDIRPSLSRSTIDRSRDSSSGGGSSSSSRHRSDPSMTTSAIEKTATSSCVFSPHHQLHSSMN